jgi:vitamin B12 transporter
MKTILLRAVLASLLFIPIGKSSNAQSDPPDAQLRGILLDASRGGVGGVHVTAQLVGDSQAHLWKATSTTAGEYALSVPEGKYHVVFQRAPFVTREFDLDLRSGPTRVLDLRFELERVSSSVVVTAEAEPLPIQQTTASVTVLARADIDARQSITLLDALLYVPGVSIGRTGPEGGTASIFLNGGNSSYAKVLVDGTPVNEPGNAVDFSNFTLDNVDKLEIVRGAESAIYGTDAVAGVIQVITHRGTTRIPEVSVSAEGGTYGSGRGGAQLSGLLGPFDYSAAASYFSTEGPDSENNFLNRTLSGNFGYRLGEDNQLRLILRNSASSAQTPGQTLLLPPNLDEHTDYHFLSSNARWDFATGKHWHHHLSGAESYNHEFIANPVQSYYATDPFAFCPQTSPTAVATAEFCDFLFTVRNQYNRASLNAQTSYLLPNFAASAGYQYEAENGTQQSLTEVSFAPPAFAFVGPHLRRDNQGGFLDFHYSPHPRATLDFGARAEANGNFGTRVVPRAGASLTLLQGRGFWGETRLRAFYGEGIKEPRFDQSFGADPCFPGNPSLKPEASKTWNVGLEQKLSDSRIKLSADFFNNRFYDIISFGYFPQPNPNFCGSYFNTDLARARGMNLAGQASLGHGIFVGGSYSFDDSRILKSENPFFDPSQVPGNHLLRRPINAGAVFLRAAYHGLDWTISGYFSGVRTDTNFIDPTVTNNSGYARFDAAVHYLFGRGVTAYARATNLFDKSYQDALGYPALGREVLVGMKYRFGGKN